MPQVHEATDVAALTAVVAAFVPRPTDGLSDAELMDEQRTMAEVRRRVDARSAELADAIAYRSRRELGHSGLAQRLGARTPEKLVQTLTGSSFREAQTFIRVGELIAIHPTLPR